MIQEIINRQKEIKDMLFNSYHNNHLAHAYIFNGSNGIGKKELALYFAAMMYCKHDVCFECEECRTIFNEEHINLYIVKSEGNIIKKDQVTDLQKEFSKTSLVDGPRIYIIEDADKLNIQSANSLLKFIEEPLNNKTYALLLTNNIENILPTIISRCGIINFKSTSKQIFTKILKDNGINTYANIISEFTQNLEEAKQLYEDERFLKTFDLCKEFAKIKNSKESVIYLQKNLSFFENANNLKTYLEVLALFYEELLKNEISNFDYMKDDFLEMKDIKNTETLIKELELILNLRNKINSNVASKNIIINLFVNLF